MGGWERKCVVIRLQSNCRYIWTYFLGLPIGLLGTLVSIQGIAQAQGRVIVLAILALLLMVFLFVVSLWAILLDWQWVTVYEDRISVRCLLFEIRSIPISRIKRCWVCPVWIQHYKRWGATHDFLVIDTAKTRKKHTIPDGFSSRKHRYIILPDTMENRYALRQLPEEVRRELL